VDAGVNRSESPPHSRRGMALLRFLVLVVAAAALAALAARFGIATDYGYLRASLLSGTVGGNYYALATRLADRAKGQRGNLRVVPTAGSVENVSRLVAAEKDCSAHFAFVQDGTPVPPEAGLETLGRLPDPESLLLLARRGRPFTEFADFRGISLGVGPQGSGTGYLLRDLLDDPDMREMGVRTSSHSFEEQAALVASGRLDLAAFVMNDDAPLLREIIQKYDLDIVSPQNLAGLLARHPWLDVGRIAAGRYDVVRPTPPADRPVARIDTLVVASPCAKRAERVVMLMLLAAELPGFVRANPPRATGSQTTLALAAEARQFFPSGEPELADRYFPWLVNLMSPAYWVYLVMAITLLFNAMRGYSRFRLWRIDAAREKLEKSVEELLGKGLTHEQMRERAAALSSAGGPIRETARRLFDEFQDLRARCQRQVGSVFTPMGDEIYYRYQESLIAQAATILSALIGPTR
jgi:TRAP-type uncharacterized transport system substrate-binding protein